MAAVTLTKYQALGNDYLVLDLPTDLAAVLPLVPRICDRHRGIGGDGLVAFDRRTYAVRIFNPDGSEAEKSGNGLRIAACHAVLEHDAPERFELRTLDRANQVTILDVSGVTVRAELDIGPPAFRSDEHGWDLDTPVGRVRCHPVNVGNPHCVVLGQPVTLERCLELGPHLERHPRFPNRTNVQLAERLDGRTAHCEIWERGAGYTLASGTSASAVAAALMRLGLVDATVDVHMPGGSLTVRRMHDGHLLQSGPAQRVFRAMLTLSDLIPG